VSRDWEKADKVLVLAGVLLTLLLLAVIGAFIYMTITGGLNTPGGYVPGVPAVPGYSGHTGRVQP
jgi:hypothetical protein